MQTATVTTTPAVSRFLKTFLAEDGTTPLPPSTLPPPNHRCPYCTELLEAEEIKDGYCWSCLTPLNGTL
jgi:hypothetical protein